jgi:hypothetical protein
VATRREELAEAATDYALEHGLIGLSLRPLAEALGTSDRSVRSLQELRASPDLRTAVLDLWRAVTTGPQQRCQRLYVEAAALGLFGREPYATAVRETNADWVAAVATHFCRAGLGKAAARQATVLVDATFMGLQLDEPLDSHAQLRRTVSDLADAVVARWGAAQPGRA